MQILLQIMVLIPLCGFVLSLFAPLNNENRIAGIAFYSILGQSLLSAVFFILWLLLGRNTAEAAVLLTSGQDSFSIHFMFDLNAAVFLAVGGIISTLIILYSRIYLHREANYKRFFCIILLFYSGYVLTVLSANLETWFIGWEFLGISSFLLISFYKDRYLPVKNAYKVFSIYRLADIGIILAIWAVHRLLNSESDFLLLNNSQYIASHLPQDRLIMAFVGLMLLLAAVAKSAQIPFSSWLPRAMEGPTSSSAIFYGSLSVHMGVFLLLRTADFWQHLWLVRILIGVIGLATAIVAGGIARVQSSVKSQIAYSSVGQIGLMFVELALGLDWLALIHFSGNAFFRTYQLLISPSIVSHEMRKLIYSHDERARPLESLFPKKLRYSLYLLCLKEFNLDLLQYSLLWRPVKYLGIKLNFMHFRYQLGLFIFSLLGGIVLLNNSLTGDNGIVTHALAVIFAICGIVALLKAFTCRSKASSAWLLVIINHCYLVLSLSCKEHFYVNELVIYLSGVVIAGIGGYYCLKRLRRDEGVIKLDGFYGYSVRHPRLELGFLLCCLGLMAFPITPTFIGEDLLFAHLGRGQFLLVFMVALSFILSGLAVVRIYARVFLGFDRKITAKYAPRYF